MVKYLTAFLFILVNLNLSAVGQYAIDDQVRSIPDRQARDVKALAQYINKKASSNKQAVRGVYVWLTNNITYDVKSFMKGRAVESEPSAVLNNKIAVCHGYSRLFKALCDEMGIQSEIIPGYSRGYGNENRKRFQNTDHAWNAVKLEGKWYLLDATWGAGGINSTGNFEKKFNEDYFLSVPETFVHRHLPLLPMWQLLNCPVKLAEFEKGIPAVKQAVNKQDNCINYQDSIAYFTGLPTEKKKLKEAESAYRFNSQNHEALALGYIDYSFYISSQIKKRMTSRQEIQEAIQQQEKSLKYLLKAEKLLKKASSSSSLRHNRQIVQHNLQNARKNIKAMKRAIGS
jgi:hypothetical protein